MDRKLLAGWNRLSHKSIGGDIVVHLHENDTRNRVDSQDQRCAPIIRLIPCAGPKAVESVGFLGGVMIVEVRK